MPKCRRRNIMKPCDKQQWDDHRKRRETKQMFHCKSRTYWWLKRETTDDCDREGDCWRRFTNQRRSTDRIDRAKQIGCSKQQNLLRSIVTCKQETIREERRRFHNCKRITKLDKHHYRGNTSMCILQRCSMMACKQVSTSQLGCKRGKPIFTIDRSREREMSQLGYGWGLPIAASDRSTEERRPDIHLLP